MNLSLSYWKREKNFRAQDKGYARDPEGFPINFLFKRLKDEVDELEEMIKGYYSQDFSYVGEDQNLCITQECADIVNSAKKNKKKVFAVGTTSMRAIESSVSTEGMLKPYNGWTNKFIFIPYDFSIADALITNFHTPLSTLLMMVTAFGGYDLMMSAYQEAIKEKYNFYSYGDAMLIL